MLSQLEKGWILFLALSLLAVLRLCLSLSSFIRFDGVF